MATISSPGIGSGLDVNSIVTQLMQVESQPLVALQKKEASYSAQLTALGTLNSAVGGFQSAVAALNNPSKFQSLIATPADNSVLGASATTSAVAGTYGVNVNQLAQSQSLVSTGQSSLTTSIGSGASTTLTFSFGSITGGTFTSAGSKLGQAVVSSGIAANSLTINGTTISTSGATNSAAALASQINLQTNSTGVTATAAATDTGALGNFTTTAGDGYTLTVGGVSILNNAVGGTAAADVDAAVAAAAANLTAAGISYSGTAAAGTLRFTAATGANIAVQESGGGVTGGFASTIGIGSTKTFASSVSLTSANAIVVGGSNPQIAGFNPGTQTVGTYSGATFTQDATQTTGTVTIDSSNNSLQGIRDAINNANIGVTASIVSDGSASPYRLVLTSTKTGATSSMKITASAGDASIAGLLSYDPSGTQNLQQSNAAQNTLASVNGVSVSSSTNSIAGAIQGVTLNVVKTGSTSVSVSRDTATIMSSVNSLVQSYNSLHQTIAGLTKYDPTTKIAGPLLGDPTVQSLENGVRQALSGAIPQLSGNNVRLLSDIGVSFQKDGTLSLDGTKLSNAIKNNPGDFASLFASVGKATDSLVGFAGSTTATQPGSYAVSVTRLATQGNEVGSAAAGLTITSGNNDTLSVALNGISATVTIPAGVYSSIDALTSAVQSAINGASSFSSTGTSVTVGHDGSNILTVTSSQYGSSSTVSITGNGAANLLGNAPTSTSGVDVAGTIGGFGATGQGQMLTGQSGTGVEGLALTVSGGSTGARGTLNFSQGYGYKLTQLMNGYVGSTGILAGRTNGINSSITDLHNQEDELNTRLARVEQTYRAQFTALDSLISSMKQTSAFLTQQLASSTKSS